MSTQSTTVLDQVRQVVRDAGLGYRVNDTELNRVIASADPKVECERLIQEKGGRASDYQYLIDQVVAVVQSGAPQDATTGTQDADTADVEGLEFSHTSVVDAFTTADDAEVFWLMLKARLEEVADTLRTGAHRLGARSEDVEALLNEAGLVVKEEKASPQDIQAKVERQIKKAQKAIKKAKKLRSNS